jgi:UDP-N-acetylmuramoyl-tripeptide--D-alanyl-D-alanine ligase
MIYYGTTPEAFVYGKITGTDPTLEISWRKGNSREIDTFFDCKTNLVGGYNFENTLAAICVASYFGVGVEEINRSITGYLPQNNRSQNLRTTKNRLIVDAYNANPGSMTAALDNFLTLNVSPKMVILGEMRELGEYSREEHRKLADRLLESHLDKVILCGEKFSDFRSASPEWLIFDRTPDLIDYLQTENISGYHILIKGSRTNQLEKTLVFL